MFEDFGEETVFEYKEVYIWTTGDPLRQAITCDFHFLDVEVVRWKGRV